MPEKKRVKARKRRRSGLKQSKVEKKQSKFSKFREYYRSKKDTPLFVFFEWVRIILIAAVVALLLNCFVIFNAIVPSASMETTIMTGTRMIGNRLAYSFGNTPERGDIVIFKYPDDETQVFVKRVIGIPGDTVEIISGVTYVNGEAIDEYYLTETPFELDFGPYEVPEGCYFMLGDNRNNSKDSRYWTNTYVEEDAILAKAVVKYWPLSEIGFVDSD